MCWSNTRFVPCVLQCLHVTAYIGANTRAIDDSNDFADCITHHVANCKSHGVTHDGANGCAHCGTHSLSHAIVSVSATGS